MALLLLVGSPFLNVRWGYPDDRVLPESASSRQVGNELRNDFADDNSKAVHVVIPDADGLTADQLGQYAAALSRVPDVVDVSAPSGNLRQRPAGRASRRTNRHCRRQYVSDHQQQRTPVFADLGHAQLDALHAVSAPRRTNRRVRRAGPDQPGQREFHHVADTVGAGLDRGGHVDTAVLAHRESGAAREGDRSQRVVADSGIRRTGVDISKTAIWAPSVRTSTGTLVANLPILLFCIAFGLSMDYEVFLISRIREYWLKLSKDGSGLTPREANNESVALRPCPHRTGES